MESPVPSKPRIVALGGGASKVVDRLVRDGAVDADFIALNADAQGRSLTSRYGCDGVERA